MGKFFPEGTVPSVPIYTIHRDLEICGDDVEAFRPERWFELNHAWIQEMLFPFSHGPRSVKLCSLHAWIALTKMIIVNYRACVARNVAIVTLLIFIATIFRHCTIILDEDQTKPASNLSLANPPIN